MAAILCLVLVVCAILVRWNHAKRPTVQKIERALIEAGIRAGSPANRVLSVLDSLHATHSQLERPGIIAANFGKSWTRLIVYAEVFGTFRFDSTSHLVSQKIEEIATGP